MNTKLLTHVKELFNSDMVPMSINRANRIKWIKSIRLLGRNWLLHENALPRPNSVLYVEPVPVVRAPIVLVPRRSKKTA